MKCKFCHGNLGAIETQNHPNPDFAEFRTCLKCGHQWAKVHWAWLERIEKALENDTTKAKNMKTQTRAEQVTLPSMITDEQIIEETNRKSLAIAKKRVESVRLLFMSKSFIPPRAWYIYYACLENPKSLKMIAKELGYKGQSAVSNQYKGKTFSDWLMEKGLIEFAYKRGREIFYKSNLKFLTDIHNKIYRIFENVNLNKGCKKCQE